MHGRKLTALCGLIIIWASGGFCQGLPQSAPLTGRNDLSADMVAGIERFLRRETDRALSERSKQWKRDFSGDYQKSVQPQRERLRKLIGAVNPRVSSTNSNAPIQIAETAAFIVYSVRWPVLNGVSGEGLWLLPKTAPLAAIIALPDADQIPEMLVGLAPGLPPERQFARRLAEQGCAVLVPVLIDRADTWSGNSEIKRFTNQPHREWIYRQSFELGRHIIGYEVEKVSAGLDWIARTIATPESSSATNLPQGVIGYAEGGLIAFYAAALDSRIQAALVSGYFDSRQQLSEEPIYRNLFGLLLDFGDAEIATLIAPRSLIVEYSTVPRVDGPPKPREGRSGAAPGRLQTPDYDSVEKEFERARTLLKGGDATKFDHLTLISGAEGMATGPGSDRAMVALMNSLGARSDQMKPSGEIPTDSRQGFDPAERQRGQLKELEAYTQKVFLDGERARKDYFWSALPASATDWAAAKAPLRDRFWSEVIGRFPSPAGPTNARTRRLNFAAANPASTNAAPPKWTGYEVVLDVFPDVFAWGYLLVPNDLKPGERRPVVVCQHGLEGVPADVINENLATQAFRYYKAFAANLATEGFVVFAPHNPYRGEDKFRHLQRRANPLGKSLFSIIIAQHERILGWLGGLPFVDPHRIGFYGLSYGGKTAMRVPAVLDSYALSICSADFNEWVRKNVSVDFPISYMFTGEYEMPEWDLGHTFNYAEMAGLIAPRPFMVERGHGDGVGLDEWVSYEFAKVRSLYERLGIGDRAELEFFDGPHTIHGVGTFQFLKKHLDWPKP